MQVSTVLEIKNLTAEGYYSITGSRGLQLRVTKYGKEFYFRYSWKGKRQLFKWFKAHAWKACKPFKGFGGSNPPLSAIH